MARRAIQRGDPDETDDGPSSEDVERFSGVTQNCPHCGVELYDDAELCWKCGMAVTQAARKGSSVWVIVVVVLLIVSLAVWQLF